MVLVPFNPNTIPMGPPPIAPWHPVLPWGPPGRTSDPLEPPYEITYGDVTTPSVFTLRNLGQNAGSA